MIDINITPEMLAEATEMANSMGELNNSIRKGTGNLAGFLGEICFLKCFPYATRDNSYDHDIKVVDKLFEIKTKDRTVVPKPYFECSIANYNTKQKADYYAFVSLLRVGQLYTNGYILGFIKKDEYFKKARFLKKGDIDPSNKWTVNADCYNLEIGALRAFERMK